MSTSWLKDAIERAGKSFTGAAITWAFEGVISGGIHAVGRGGLWWQCAEFGAGTAIVSVVFSWWSRRIGSRGTASLTKVVEYAAIPAERRPDGYKSVGR